MILDIAQNLKYLLSDPSEKQFADPCLSEEENVKNAD